MKITKALHYLAVALILASVLLLIKSNYDSFNRQNRWYRTSGNLLAVDMIKYLRKEYEPLRNRIEWFIKNEPDVDKIFDYLELLRKNDTVSSAFIEKYTTTSKIPAKKSKKSASKDKYLTRNKKITDPKLTPPDKTDMNQYVRDIIRTEKKDLPFRIPRYMFGRRDSSAVWVVFPLNIESENEMLMLGLGFKRLQNLEEVKKNFIRSNFPQHPVWQWIVWPGDDDFALELTNHLGEPVLLIGTKNEKILLTDHNLNIHDIEYSGWKINVWYRKLDFLPQMIMVVVMILGTVLYIVTDKSIKRHHGIF